MRKILPENALKKSKLLRQIGECHEIALVASLNRLRVTKINCYHKILREIQLHFILIDLKIQNFHPRLIRAEALLKEIDPHLRQDAHKETAINFIGESAKLNFRPPRQGSLI